MQFFKKGEWKIFWPFYMALFVGISTPGIYVIQTLFFLSRGITLTQLGIAFGLYSLFSILAEIPTGAVADVFGKKISIQIHWIIHAITTFAFIFINAPWQIYLLFAVQGISGTFASGAFDALAYNTCINNKRKDLINEFFAKINFITQAGHFLSYLGTVVILYLVGSEKTYLIFNRGYTGMDLLWFTGALGFFFAFLIFFKFKEKNKSRKINIKKDIVKTHQTAIKGLKYAKNHIIIRKLFLASFFLTISYILFSDYVHQSFLLDLGFGAEKIALTIALASVVGAVFTLIPKSIEKKFKTEKHFVEFTIILQLILLVGLFFFNKIFAFSLFFFFIYYNVHRCLRGPIFLPFMQLFMKDKMRATLGSIESLLANVAGVVFFPLAGYMVDNVGVINTTIASVIPLIIGLFILYSVKLKKRISH
jgi:MFS family permease